MTLEEAEAELKAIGNVPPMTDAEIEDHMAAIRSIALDEYIDSLPVPISTQELVTIHSFVSWLREYPRHASLILGKTKV